MPATIATQVIDTLAAAADRRTAPGCPQDAASAAAALCEELHRRFDLDFAVIELPSETTLAGNASPGVMAAFRDEMATVVSTGKARLLRDSSSCAALFIPLGSFDLNADGGPAHWIAWAPCSHPARDDRQIQQTAELFAEKLQAEREAESQRDEARRLSDHIGATFEEISLIYRLTRNLSISHKPAEIGAQALEWLEDVVQAEGFAIFYDSKYDADLLSRDDAQSPIFLTRGDVPVSTERFIDLLQLMGNRDLTRAVVQNHGIAEDTAGKFADVRQFVLAPLHEGERRFGWVAAFNQVLNLEFGSGEAGLLASIGAILGMHCGNVDLYEQQAELFSGVVRAMSSAIDAKDPYTRGHSDRVARVAVRLAQELGCDETTIRTLYLAGLLHDVGKIGIDDNVLRKPGKLTDAEYEHIKAHVEIGYRILRGLKKMGHVLPIVLHHHESWDGKGYPFGLQGSNIPYLARIVAVADAYDAMSSDRPYRKGMEDDKLDAIFRAGAGKQWDPDVVDAFFRVRDDIRNISLQRPDPIDAVAVEWTH